MIVSLGILAHNEAETIAGTIISLASQDALTHPSAAGIDRWQVIVVANGCTDGTEQVAERAIREAGLAGEARVETLPQGDKAAAWNFFVHTASAPDADVLVLLDADVEFGQPSTITRCLATLEADDHARVVVDTPVKDLARKPRRTVREQLLLRAGGTPSEQVAISGQFYCGRAQVLRDIWLPGGLPVEDGYVYSMVITDAFRAPVDTARVVRAPVASHYFRSEHTLRGLMRHERRLVIGSALNSYMLWQFLQFAVEAEGRGAGDFVRRRLEADPNWYQAMMSKHVAMRGWWVLPGGMVTRRLRPLRQGGWRQRPQSVPIACASFVLDIPILASANRTLKRQGGVGHW